jgi:tRNA-2-methylthio-N6-dimethylallyladenosine synthase
MVDIRITEVLNYTLRGDLISEPTSTHVH